MWGIFVRDCLCVWAVIFLMYVIPSVMVQSYICYVTHSWSWTVKIQWLFLKCVESGGESARCFDISSAACLKDGNSDQTCSQSLKVSGGLESQTSSLKVMIHPSERIGQQPKKQTKKQFFRFVDQAFSRFSSKPSITQPFFFVLLCVVKHTRTRQSTVVQI